MSNPDDVVDNWTKHKDKKSGHKYYYNKVTKKTTWSAPDCVKRAKAMKKQSKAKIQAPQQKAVPQPTNSAASSTSGWKSSVDPKSGKKYYYNKSTGQRSWKPPPGVDTSSISHKASKLSTKSSDSSSPNPSSIVSPRLDAPDSDVLSATSLSGTSVTEELGTIKQPETKKQPTLTTEATILVTPLAAATPAAATNNDSQKLTKPKKQKPVWKAVMDKKTGKTYYYNRKTRETSWKKPAGYSSGSLGSSSSRQSSKSSASNVSNRSPPLPNYDILNSLDDDELALLNAAALADSQVSEVSASLSQPTGFLESAVSTGLRLKGEQLAKLAKDRQEDKEASFKYPTAIVEPENSSNDWKISPEMSATLRPSKSIESAHSQEDGDDSTNASKRRSQRPQGGFLGAAAVVIPEITPQEELTSSSDDDLSSEISPPIHNTDASIPQVAAVSIQPDSDSEPEQGQSDNDYYAEEPPQDEDDDEDEPVTPTKTSAKSNENIEPSSLITNLDIHTDWRIAYDSSRGNTPYWHNIRTRKTSWKEPSEWTRAKALESKYQILASSSLFNGSGNLNKSVTLGGPSVHGTKGQGQLGLNLGNMAGNAFSIPQPLVSPKWDSLSNRRLIWLRNLKDDSSTLSTLSNWTPANYSVLFLHGEAPQPSSTDLWENWVKCILTSLYRSASDDSPQMALTHTLCANPQVFSNIYWWTAMPYAVPDDNSSNTKSIQSLYQHFDQPGKSDIQYSIHSLARHPYFDDSKPVAEDLRAIVLAKLIENSKSNKSCIIVHGIGAFVLADVLWLIENSPHLSHHKESISIDKIITLGSCLGNKILDSKLLKNRYSYSSSLSTNSGFPSVKSAIHLSALNDGFSTASSNFKFCNSSTKETTVQVANHWKDGNSMRNPHGQYGYLVSEQVRDAIVEFFDIR